MIPALLVLAWLAVAGVGGPFAGKLTDVQSNDSTSFLPASADATKVAEFQREFSDSDVIPAVVVAERESGVTPGDLEFLGTLAGTDVPGVVGGGSPPVPSEDGRAAQVIVPVDATGDPGETVDELREHISSGVPGGLSVYVSGPAGQTADLSEAFAGIDGLLLLVAGAVVIVILIVVYRSPILPFVVVLSAVFALALASALVYVLADAGAIALNGQSQGILFILVFGAATDYALLLVSRFREELRDRDDRYEAMRRAWRGVLEPISASAGTVILGVLCLLLSDLNSNRGLGPVAALGIAASYVASLTFLPAALVLIGRAAFWPKRPTVVTAPEDATRAHEQGLWWRLSRVVATRHTRVWIGTGLLLVVCAAFVPQFESSGVPQSSVFLNRVESVEGQDVLGEHFPGGSGSPTLVVAGAADADGVARALDGVDGVAPGGVRFVSETGAPAGPPKTVDGQVMAQVTLTDPADSDEAVDTVSRIRDEFASGTWQGGEVLVGGPTATQLDTQTTAARDRSVVIPAVLVVVFVVLALLMRALVAPVMLLATTVLSFASALGVSGLVFDHLFHFPGSDPVVPLFGFVFLVALGIDYNIFLMTRVREEALRHGTAEGVRRGLAITGGVITSAGVVLAATFGALAVIPLQFLAQIAFIVAFGVLLDTLVVRTLLVPALTLEIGRRVWWPSALARNDGRD
nr:efflux RND transporter permease subunit [Rhodococcus sp. HNM0569]